MKTEKNYPCFRVSAPELKEHKAFVRWLNAGACGRKDQDGGPSNIATWHRPNVGPNLDTPLDDYSDFFFWFENGEGSDSDMPEDVWKQFMEAVDGYNCCGIIWVVFF